jgi:agmatinase
MEKFEIFRGILEQDFAKANCTFTGIPFDKNASIGKGASLAPDHIRELSRMVPATTMNGYILEDVRLYDNGNITTENFDKIKAKVLQIYKNGKFNFIIGGDHSIAIPTEQAFYDYATSLGKIPTIIHIDAHPDICDIYEDNKFSHACPNKRSLDYGYKDENITIVGVRGFEAQETKLFMEHPLIDVFKASDVRLMGARGLVNYLKNKYDDNHLIYLSYDIDANDPAYAPGTGTPEPFGLTNWEVIDTITGIISQLNVGTFDLVEVSPKLDTNDMTSYLAIKTIYEILYTWKNK